MSRPPPSRHCTCWNVCLEKSICILRELLYRWDNQIGDIMRSCPMEFYYLTLRVRLCVFANALVIPLFINFLWVFMNLLLYLFNITLFFSYRLASNKHISQLIEAKTPTNSASLVAMVINGLRKSHLFENIFRNNWAPWEQNVLNSLYSSAWYVSFREPIAFEGNFSSSS